jgi:hypothetical protein
MTPPDIGARDVPLLTTKLYIPPPRPSAVPRPRLIQRLEDGLRLTRRSRHAEPTCPSHTDATTMQCVALIRPKRAPSSAVRYASSRSSGV